MSNNNPGNNNGNGNNYNGNNNNGGGGGEGLGAGGVIGIIILVFGICGFITAWILIRERTRRMELNRIRDEENTTAVSPVSEKKTALDLERMGLRAELGLAKNEIEFEGDDLTPLYALKAERIQRIAALLSHTITLFEIVGFPPDATHNPLILLLKQIQSLQQTTHHTVEATTPVAKTFLENSLAQHKCLPKPLSLTKECISHLEAMVSALQKVEETQKTAEETQDAFEARLKASKEAADKTCSDAENNMRKKMDEVGAKMSVMEAEADKFKQLASAAESARIAIEIKTKEDEAATKSRIKQLRGELMDLEENELILTESMTKQERLSLLEDLIGEKVSRLNRLAAVTAEFYKLLKSLHFPKDDPLTSFLITLPDGLPENPSRRALQLRAKQLFVASITATKSLPPPFTFTRSYIEALEDRRDEVRDQVMEVEAREMDCQHLMDEITKLHEKLNIAVDERPPLVMDISKMDEYTILVKELRERWDESKQGEVDKDRLQAMREELLDLTEAEFSEKQKDANSKEERWSTVELLVTEKIKRITTLSSLSAELYLLYETTTGIPDKTIQETLLKSFLITLPSGLGDTPTLDALQNHAKELLTSYYSLNHSLPKPLSIARSCADDLKAKINAIKKIQREKVEREEELKRLIVDIRELWDQLSIPEKDRVALVEDVSKMKEYTSIADKLRKKWSETKKLEIDQTVARLKAVWLECAVGRQEQESFWNRCKPIYSPTALSEMLKEIANANLRRERVMKISKLIQERKEFIQKLIEFEKAAQDPSRFSGSSIRLLEEEKFRKSALPSLKKMENGIRKQLNEYEEVSEYAFSVDGQPYIEILDNEVKDRLSNTSVLVFFNKKG
ncbi:carboxypeptidase C prc1, partial [Podochytrium sp. JEL0797]